MVIGEFLCEHVTVATLLAANHTIYHRDLFMVTAEESGLDDRHCTYCTNETECCSIETCDCTVRSQVEYFINRDNSFR